MSIQAMKAQQEVAARIGSERLLRAQLRAGQHFIHDFAQFRAVCIAAGFAL